jgi:hypothetical protein
MEAANLEVLACPLFSGRSRFTKNAIHCPHVS